MDRYHTEAGQRAAAVYDSYDTLRSQKLRREAAPRTTSSPGTRVTAVEEREQISVQQRQQRQRTTCTRAFEGTIHATPPYTHTITSNTCLTEKHDRDHVNTNYQGS